MTATAVRRPRTTQATHWADDIANAIRAARAELGPAAEGWNVDETLTGVVVTCPDGAHVELDYTLPTTLDTENRYRRILATHRFDTIEAQLTRQREASRRAATERNTSALDRAAGLVDDPEPRLDDLLRFHARPRRWDLTITPDTAAALLRFNDSNYRTMSHTAVDDYVAALVGGFARYTHQGIALAWDLVRDRPVLLDGQHRLAAIVKAKTPWRMQVTAGLDVDVAMVLDAPRKRSLTLGLRRSGLRLPHVAGPAARLVYAWRHWDPRDTRRPVPPLLVEQLTVGDGTPEHPGDQDRYEAAARYGKLIKNKRHGLNGNAAAAAAFAYLLWDRCGYLSHDGDGPVVTDAYENAATLAYEFLYQARTGVDLTPTSPVLLLQQTIRRLHWDSRIVPSWMELAVWLRAWADFAAGKTTTSRTNYELSDSAPYPKVVYLPDMEAARAAHRAR